MVKLYVGSEIKKIKSIFDNDVKRSWGKKRV